MNEKRRTGSHREITRRERQESRETEVGKKKKMMAERERGERYRGETG